ncbi:hypothetical protein ACIA5D_42665 [Actinoplanes sp. NPDC051513]|uniref:hypothetical protein n=1 Tax=Actinoplanes sp. NPDC051513 TaxID=3363908 RepID=UPI0037B9E00A
MHAASPASLGARRLLSSAARRLHTADPVGLLGGYLDESLALPPGAQAYRRPHAFETRFSERAPSTLAFDLSPADPLAGPPERVAGATRAMRQVVGGTFGPRALSWVDGRSEPLSYGSGDAWFSSCFDTAGLRESEVTYAWAPQTADSLARPIHEAVQAATEAMPSLRPALTTVRCGRTYGSQEITFGVDGALRLAELRPVMERFGLGDQHTRLTNALAFVLGARFVLPPDTTLLTLRPSPGGMEMRVDVDLEAIPDIPPNVASLLQLQLVERPQGLRALERWVGAMTPDGMVNPGELALLSVVVAPGCGPRLAIQLRPSAILATPDAGPPTPAPPAPAPAPAPAPETVAAGLGPRRSPWDPRR